ncbi:sulfite exporter TauE/SafE family protein [Rhodobacteraceae bacterium DSL-40]|uniref:sulfite exporter TauE/SafE family protein n=1 Tax=Amaricoccus sp. B4 TaxID=3368557 RepID=UPI0013A6C90E
MDHFALYALAAFIVGTSKGGLSSAAALAIPLLSIWMDPLTAAGVLLPVYIASDVFGVWLYRHEYSTPNLKVLIPAGAAGVAIAALLAGWLSGPLATLLTGAIGLSYCIQATVRKLRAQTAPHPFDARKGVFWGILTGITSFISHSGAPPFQAFVLPQGLPKMNYAGTVTIVFAAVNLCKLPAYAAVGLMHDFAWKGFFAMAAIAAAGVLTGRKITQWLPDRIYIAFIQVTLFVLSVYLVWEGLAALA